MDDTRYYGDFDEDNNNNDDDIIESIIPKSLNYAKQSNFDDAVLKDINVDDKKSEIQVLLHSKKRNRHIMIRYKKNGVFISFKTNIYVGPLRE